VGRKLGLAPAQANEEVVAAKTIHVRRAISGAGIRGQLDKDLVSARQPMLIEDAVHVHDVEDEIPLLEHRPVLPRSAPRRGVQILLERIPSPVRQPVDGSRSVRAFVERANYQLLDGTVRVLTIAAPFGGIASSRRSASLISISAIEVSRGSAPRVRARRPSLRTSSTGVSKRASNPRGVGRVEPAALNAKQVPSSIRARSFIRVSGARSSRVQFVVARSVGRSDTGSAAAGASPPGRRAPRR